MYTFREYKEEDIPLIHSSWGKSFYCWTTQKEDSSEFEFLSKHRVFREQILARESTKVIVCISKENIDQIIGWIIFEENKEWEHSILHYIYIKRTFTGFKLSAELLNQIKGEKPVLYTHKTIISEEILKKKPRPNFIYVPFLI